MGHRPVVGVPALSLLPGCPPGGQGEARVVAQPTHHAPTSCTGLGHGLPLQVAVTRAQEYLNLALRRSYPPGKGAGPVNHAAALNV